MNASIWTITESTEVDCPTTRWTEEIPGEITEENSVEAFILQALYEDAVKVVHPAGDELHDGYLIHCSVDRAEDGSEWLFFHLWKVKRSLAMKCILSCHFSAERETAEISSELSRELRGALDTAGTLELEAWEVEDSLADLDVQVSVAESKAPGRVALDVTYGPGLIFHGFPLKDGSDVARCIRQVRELVREVR